MTLLQFYKGADKNYWRHYHLGRPKKHHDIRYGSKSLLWFGSDPEIAAVKVWYDMISSFGLSFRRLSKDIIVLLVGRLIGQDFLNMEQFFIHDKFFPCVERDLKRKIENRRKLDPAILWNERMQNPVCS